MLKSLKVYLDTSVPNGYYDDKNLERQRVTKEFWPKLKEYQVFISDVVIDEIKATGEEERKQGLLKLVGEFVSLSSETIEIKALAEEYVTRGIIPAKHIKDAIHIAVASVNSLDILVSWNFEHIVKLKTKREVNVINVLFGYKQIEIIDPAML
jgi:predicted nucleic acid-binding protein